MNRCMAMLIAVALMLGFASCARWENDNPAFSAKPADTIEELS